MLKSSMNLSKFLTRYCNITGKDLSRLHHEDVYWLFPNLKRATFEEVERYPGLVATGQIILVDDGRKIIPYKTPELQYDELEEPTEFIMEDKTDGPKVDYGKHDYTKMNVFELRQMLRRKFNSALNQKYARRELEERGIVLSKKYDRNEEKRKIERIKNEKY